MRKELKGQLLRGRSFCLFVLFAKFAVSALAQATEPEAKNAQSQSIAETNNLLLNFHSTPVSQVFDYLSAAAGFIIEKQTEFSGTVDCWSKHRVSPEEAIELLNSALKPSGCALVRHGRVLTILRSEQAQRANLQVFTGSDPVKIEASDETVTQIVPLRYLTASQLVNNLQPLLPPSAALSYNESANALLLVARKSEIRRMLQIVQALDQSLAAQSSIQVFALRNGDAKAVAAILQQTFDSSKSGQSSESLNVIASGDFGPPGFPGPDLVANAAQANSSSSAGKVVAVGEEHSNSVIVSAPASSMALIRSVIRQLDQPGTSPKELRLFHLINADATELAAQLALLFPDSSANSNDDSQMPVFAGPMPPPGMDPGSSSDTEEVSGSRKSQSSRVLAVADPRTSSLLVSAAKGLMPQIAKMVAQLDADSGKKELVGFWDLKNADPQDVNQVLQTLFNRNNVARNNNSSQASPLLGANNPLTIRETQQQTSSNTRTATTGGSGQPAAAPGGGSAVP